MEGADRGMAFSVGRAKNEAVAHFLAGFIRKSNSQDLLPLLQTWDQMQNAVGQGVGLACAGARDNEKMPVSVRDSLPLRFIGIGGFGK